MSILLNKEYLIISLAALASIILIPVLSYAILVLLLLLGIFAIGKSNIKYLTIFTFLAIPSSINPDIRNLLNIINFCFLLYLVIDKHGIDIKKLQLIPRQLTQFFLFILFSMVLSSIFSNQLFIGLAEAGRQLIFFIIVTLYYLLFEKNDYSKVFFTIILSSVFISSSIVVNFALSNGFSKLLTFGLVHEGGLFDNVASAAGILSIAIPLNIYYMFSNKKHYIIWTFLIIVQILALLLTNSRASFFIVVLALQILLLYKYKVKALIYTLLIIFGFWYLIYASPFSEVFNVFFRLNRVLENTRYILWDMSIQIIKENWLFGTGPGQFKYYIYNHLPVLLGSWDENQIRFIHDFAGAGHSHNFYLFRIAELGILGLLSVILIPFLFFKNIFKSITNSKESSFIILLMGIGLGMFIRAMFESTGILTHGWITRDLIFWIIFIFILHNVENENINTL